MLIQSLFLLSNWEVSSNIVTTEFWVFSTTTCPTVLLIFTFLHYIATFLDVHEINKNNKNARIWKEVLVVFFNGLSQLLTRLRNMCRNLCSGRLDHTRISSEKKNYFAPLLTSSVRCTPLIQIFKQFFITLSFTILLILLIRLLIWVIFPGTQVSFCHKVFQSLLCSSICHWPQRHHLWCYIISMGCVSTLRRYFVPFFTAILNVLPGLSTDIVCLKHKITSHVEYAILRK
jgi:hypothetical protein